MSERGGVIDKVEPYSPAAKAGINPGDILLKIDGFSIRDKIDYDFYSDGRRKTLTIKRANEILEIKLNKHAYEEIGISFKEELFDGIRQCDNKCQFCFVHQLPRGLRKTLYVRDDDYRLSFLHGSFITATNLTSEDKLRIVEQKLSPLYVSVHATDDTIRREMLGCSDAPPIMDVLEWFASNRIEVHTQVVVCPGINDGQVLIKTIEDLASLYPRVASLGIIPVGLTSHRKNLPKIRHVSQEDASKIIHLVSKYQRKFLQNLFTRFVWAADELYLKSGKKFPSYDSYESFVQYENGIGLVKEWLYLESKFIKKLAKAGRKFDISADIVTGVSFAPIMSVFAKKIKDFGFDLNVHPIKNALLGDCVTVAGLLAGRDIISQLKGALETKLLIVPQVALREDRFIDDFSLHDLEAELNVTVLSCFSSPFELYSVLTSEIGTDHFQA